MLDDKVCVVTGAARGIGRATALEMAAQRARAVVVCDVNEAGAKSTAHEVSDRGAEGIAIALDITQATDVARAMNEVGQRFGRIDILHNNAGILETQLSERTTVDTIAEDCWDRVFAVNVKGTWLCTKHAVPWLRRSRSAAIVNCGSTASFVAFEGEGCYCATKAAIVALTKATALDLQSSQIRCNCYCPSFTVTEMLAPYLEAAEDRAATERELGRSHLVHRLGRPEDVGKLVCFLASDDAAFINGAAYMIDGGALAWRELRVAQIEEG